MSRPVVAALAACAIGVISACTGATPSGSVTVVDAAVVRPEPVETQLQQPSDPTRPAWAIDLADPGLTGRSLGDIRESPALLADRRLPTRDLLPPPEEDEFAWSISPITPEVRARMGESWSDRCPVGLVDLRYVTVVFRGFDGRAHTGDLVVHRTVATTVVEVFEELFAVDFPIEEMRLVTTADHHAPPTGDGNNTAAFNCRTRVGQGRWSAHAYGTAVDINPFHNPMVRRGEVVPEHGWAYVDRTRLRPGMITADSPAVRAFRAAGWQWGGDWVHSKDYMHFSTDGS